MHITSHFLQAPEEPRMELVMGILHYIRYYPSIGLYFAKGEENHLQGFLDANYAQDANNIISRGAYLFTLRLTSIS